MTVDHLEQLAIGAAILGSGGGGDSYYAQLIAQHQLEQYGLIELISIDAVKPEDMIVPIAFMGAPLVVLEKLPSGKEFRVIFDQIKQYTSKDPTLLMPAEIGGFNAFIPIIAAGMLGLPILDADLIGRAFPQLQMCSAHLNNVAAAPVFLADALGNSIIIESLDNITIESIARSIAVAVGSSVAAALYILKGNQIPKSVCTGTISQALAIGKIILDARKSKIDPVQSLIESVQGILLGSGIITDINQSVKNGFLQGTVIVANQVQEYTVHYQNENLLVSINDDNKTVCATSPDIITLLEKQTGAPIATESLIHGVEVSIVVLPAPQLWYAPQGLSVVGPRCFGYNVDYKSLNSSFSGSSL